MQQTKSFMGTKLQINTSRVESNVTQLSEYPKENQKADPRPPMLWIERSLFFAAKTRENTAKPTAADLTHPRGGSESATS
jgi:hypothetical protein